MDIRSMQYDFKQKLNKIDSQQYRNLRIPEIDWKLNEAYEIYVKTIAEPRVPSHLGFEVNQRSIDDLRTIVIEDYELSPFLMQGDPPNRREFLLPENYLFFVAGYALIEKEGCGSKRVRLTMQQHDDMFEESSMTQSSYEWGDLNSTFTRNSIRIYLDGTFTVKKLFLTYIRKHAYIHNAQDFLPTASYMLPDGTLLTGYQNCELPEHTHREIVDIAVLITTGDLQMQDYQIKQAKLSLNQIN